MEEAPSRRQPLWYAAGHIGQRIHDSIQQHAADGELHENHQGSRNSYGLDDHGTASATYTIQSQVATPTFSPVGGNYSSAQSVTISSATSGATIYYTTNGANPTTSSAVYGGPVTVGTSLTLKALTRAASSTAT